jgi:hypothetical protein
MTLTLDTTLKFNCLCMYPPLLLLCMSHAWLAALL